MTYSAEVLADTPLIYLRLGESSGTTASDSSGNGRDGTYTGSPTLGVAGALAGDADTAINCPGSGYVAVTGAAWMAVTDYSVELWIKYTSTTTAMFVSWNNLSSTKKIIELADVSGKIQITAYNTSGAGTAIVSPLTYNDGNWHHVVATKSGTTFTLYVDGSQVATGTCASANSGQLAALNINRRPDGSLFANSSYDEFAIYSGTLSSTRITAHYNAGTSTTKSGSASGGFSFSGSASGTATHSGTASGGFNLAGAASGLASHLGTASGGFDFTAAASGTADYQGSASGGFDLSGSAGGGATESGSAAGAFDYAGAATGAADYQGTVSGGFALAGVAVGTADHQGAASGGFDLTGAAAGATDYEGSAAGGFDYAGAAIGRHPRQVTTPPERLYTIPTANRTATVAAASRVYLVPEPDRTYTVPSRS